MKPRFYLPSIKADQETLVIRDTEIIHQLTNVLRLKKNDVFIAFTSQKEYELVIKEINDNHVITAVLEARTTNREPNKKLTLYLSLLKKDRFEWVLQKGTELGVHTFVPVIFDNTITRHISDNKTRRYQKIIQKATEQCGGQQPPQIEKLAKFTDILPNIKTAAGLKFIAWEGENTVHLNSACNYSTHEYHVIIGPEGGFTPREIQQAQQNNVQPVSLGIRILRAETAAIAAAIMILLKK